MNINNKKKSVPKNNFNLNLHQNDWNVTSKQLKEITSFKQKCKSEQRHTITAFFPKRNINCYIEHTWDFLKLDDVKNAFNKIIEY